MKAGINHSRDVAAVVRVSRAAFRGRRIFRYCIFYVFFSTETNAILQRINIVTIYRRLTCPATMGAGFW